jgi:hypothetical protein
MDSLIDRLPERAAKPARDKAALPSSQELPNAAIRCVDVVGLGRMGAAFAENLLAAGYRIVAYDRDSRRAQPLQVEGDLPLALAEAEKLAEPMPVASLVHDRLVAAVARGWSGLGWSALGLLAAADAGLGDPAPATQRKL